MQALCHTTHSFRLPPDGAEKTVRTAVRPAVRPDVQHASGHAGQRTDASRPTGIETDRRERAGKQVQARWIMV